MTSASLQDVSGSGSSGPAGVSPGTDPAPPASTAAPVAAAPLITAPAWGRDIVAMRAAMGSGRG